MRILIVTQYFTPEITAAPARLHPLAAGLAARGYQVEVVCEVPSHPLGLIAPGYGRRFADRRRLDGFAATYVWTYATPSKRARDRLASYASYAASATLVAAFRRRPDVVVASSPPLSVGAVGAAVAARHRVPWVLDVRDLWPEAAITFGELRSSRMIELAERLERRLYASAAAITTPTQPFREHIAARTSDPAKVFLLANGTTGEWLDAGAGEADRAAHGFPDDRFVWTYAGNLGLSQDLETAVAAAGLLGEEFRLVIVGDGASRERLERLAAARAPAAIAFMGLLPAAETARLMRASDALLVPLANRTYLGKSVPIKLYDCCAIGRPIVLAAPGEPRRLAEANDLALAVDPSDPGALAAGVRRLRDDPALRRRLAAGARAFAARNLREAGIGDFDRLLRSVAAGSAADPHV